MMMVFVAAVVMMTKSVVQDKGGEFMLMRVMAT